MINILDTINLKYKLVCVYNNSIFLKFHKKIIRANIYLLS